MRNYFDEHILDYGLEIIEKDIDLPKIEEKNPVKSEYKALWEGEPYQGYKILYSTGTGPIIFAVSAFIILVGTCVGTVGIFIQKLKGLEYFPINYCLAILGIVSIPYIILDIKDYYFRKGSKTWITKDGIVFRKGLIKKNDYLLKWNNIESAEFSKPGKVIYFELKHHLNVKLSSPNERNRKPNIQVDRMDEFMELQKMVRKFVKSVHNAA